MTTSIRKHNGMYALWTNGTYQGSFKTRREAVRWAEFRRRNAT